MDKLIVLVLMIAIMLIVTAITMMVWGVCISRMLCIDSWASKFEKTIPYCVFIGVPLLIVCTMAFLRVI